jgi:hypothetical protein
MTPDEVLKDDALTEQIRQLFGKYEWLKKK